MDDDDYWNTSETKAKAFSFDDDVLSPQEILAIGQNSGQAEFSVFSSININRAKTAALPLTSLVSPKVLELIVLAQSGRQAKDLEPEQYQPVAVSLKRLVLDRSCSLHGHRSMNSKKQLLDGAVAVGDGNAILSVVLFLIQTLKKKLVYEILSSRPSALNHYISFLHSQGKVTELTDLLTMLGRSQEAAIYQYQHVVKTHGVNVDTLLRKLNNLLTNNFNQPGVDTHQAKMVADYVKLLEWQKCVNKPELNKFSVLKCLEYCYSHHSNEGAGNALSPLTLCQRHQVSPLQYEWILLHAHGKASEWDVLESVFTKKDWLGRTTISSHIPVEILVARLSEFRASKRLLEFFVNKIANVEDRLRLAHKYKVHSVVIETLALQRDRTALANYKMSLSPQSEEHILAENTLRDPSIKWKN